MSPSCCDMCRCRVWTHGVSVCFHVLLCYCATSHLLFVNMLFFHTATCAFLVGTCGVNVANFCSASCRLEVPSEAIFLLDHLSSLCVVSGIYVSVPYWTINFLLDHAFVSCSRECPFWTTTCPKPLHVDIHADPFHNRTNETTFLFREISIIILTKQTTINKITTKYIHDTTKRARGSQISSTQPNKLIRSRHTGSGLTSYTSGDDVTEFLKHEMALLFLLLELIKQACSSFQHLLCCCNLLL